MIRLLGAIGLAVCLVTPAGAMTSAERGKLEQDTFQLINQYRKSSGMTPFIWSKAIAKIARDHSRDMATGESDFGHDGFGDRVKRMQKEYPGWAGAGENVLKTDDPQDVAQRAVTLWLHSPHHLKNIRGDYNYSGIGIAVDKDGMIYFTQLFAKVLPPKAQAVPNPQQIPDPEQGVTSPFNFLAPPTPRRN